MLHRVCNGFLLVLGCRIVLIYVSSISCCDGFLLIRSIIRRFHETWKRCAGLGTDATNNNKRYLNIYTQNAEFVCRINRGVGRRWK